MKYLVLAILLGVSVVAQEKVVLNTPVFVDPGAAEFRVFSIRLFRGINVRPDAQARIEIVFLQVDGTAFLPNGKRIECIYLGEEAETLLIGLNKANLSTNSLERRVTTRCQQDGKLGAGTITGDPQ